MKIKVERHYYQETIWSEFHKLSSSNDLILVVSFSSYKKGEVDKAVVDYGSIGYKVVSKISRKLFLYKAVVARLVPMYQRLIVGPIKYENIISNDKMRKAANAPSVDIIQYTDKDLEIMRDLRKTLTNIPSLEIVDPKTYKLPMLRLSSLWADEKDKEYDDAKKLYDKIREDYENKQKKSNESKES